MNYKVWDDAMENCSAEKTFFDTKYLELCDIFLDYPDIQVFDKLNKIDPSHQKYYDEYKAKRK
ncbi:MAG: hypothetical protein Q8K98_01510 [Bacteroidota bacterium]|nr:hypothetical protein [Bacteroidota bacterium]